MSCHRSPGAWSFHSRGPAVEKVLSLNLCVRGTNAEVVGTRSKFAPVYGRQRPAVISEVRWRDSSSISSITMQLRKKTLAEQRSSACCALVRVTRTQSTAQVNCSTYVSNRDYTRHTLVDYDVLHSTRPQCGPICHQL